jgi:hypothetical protein
VNKHVFVLALLRTKDVFTALANEKFLAFAAGGDPQQTQKCFIFLREMSRNSESGTICPFQSWIVVASNESAENRRC